MTRLRRWVRRHHELILDLLLLAAGLAVFLVCAVGTLAAWIAA